MNTGLMNQSTSDLAIRIKAARKEARLSQQALGKGIGLSDKSISAYEQGRSTPPFSKIKQIAQVTQHPISYFTNATEHETLTTIILRIEQELQEIKNRLKKS